MPHGARLSSLCEEITGNVVTDFRRPRGRLKMARHIVLVQANALPGQEEGFNKWYDEHLYEVLKTPGYVSGQRFVASLPEHPHEHKYIVLFEIETDDIGKVLASLLAPDNLAKMKTPVGLDPSSVRLTAYKPITDV